MSKIQTEDDLYEENDEVIMREIKKYVWQSKILDLFGKIIIERTASEWFLMEWLDIKSRKKLNLFVVQITLLLLIGILGNYPYQKCEGTLSSISLAIDSMPHLRFRKFVHTCKTEISRVTILCKHTIQKITVCRENMPVTTY